MKYKIMIVEDDSIILNDLLTIIDWEKHNYIVKTAFNGEKGLSVFKEFRPDIVITDIRMPFMNGLEMIEEINKINPNAKCIVLSAYDDFEYARSAVKLKIQDYILKTEIDGDMLLQKLQSVQETITKEVEDEKPAYSPLINNAIKYIAGNYKNCNLKIEDIADAVHLSTSRLSVRFKEETGKNIKEYITALRIQLAKELLLSGRYKIYEVAEMSGYSNSAYFSNVFRENTGTSPVRYYSKD